MLTHIGKHAMQRSMFYNSLMQHADSRLLANLCLTLSQHTLPEHSVQKLR